MPSTRTSLLGIYLNDHLTGAMVSTQLSRRTAKAHRGKTMGAGLEELARQIEGDRQALMEVMARLRIPVRRVRVGAGWLAERAGRLKLNGHVLTRSPLSDVLELEALRVAVQSKISCWRTLLMLAGSEPRLDARRLNELLERAYAQAETLEGLGTRATSHLWR